MVSEKLLRWLITLGIVVNGVYLIWIHAILPDQTLKVLAPSAIAISVPLSLLGIFDRYFWCLPGINKLFASPPNVQGTWKGEINSHWVNPETGQTPPPIEVYAVVRQTYSSINVGMFTKESASGTLTASITEKDGKCVIQALYSNTPDLQFRSRSPIHHGSFIMQVVGIPPQSLRGSYWTDRGSKGEISFSQRTNLLFDDFQIAANSTIWNKTDSGFGK